jgi:hypothetical protein
MTTDLQPQDIDVFWQSERAKCWVRRQEFEQLMRTYDRLREHTASRPGIDLIREEVERRRKKRDRQDQLHAPLGEEPQHLTTQEDSIPPITVECNGQGSQVEVDLEQMR